ncbi:hypothetical protein [Persicobacter psychrovividus]|uniref:DNA-binding protein n=1 Tax=Persicobacter psychrovividus TaxID=387638 RepID=A0ABM7VMD7_9BACT|nr:hypothetical protein PEPS_43610 [Persicobacter psychrovividus]
MNNSLTTSRQDITTNLELTAGQATEMGFLFMEGKRQAGGMEINESVATTRGIRLLMGFTVKVNGQEICSENFVGQKMGYSRDKVRKMVEESTFKGLEAYARRSNRPFHREATRAKLCQLLDESYYQQSDEAILDLLGRL